MPDVHFQFLQLAEIIHGAAALETLIIEDKPLDDILLQALGGPDAELGCNLRFYAVTDGDDRIKIVKFHGFITALMVSVFISSKSDDCMSLMIPLQYFQRHRLICHYANFAGY